MISPDNNMVRIITLGGMLLAGAVGLQGEEGNSVFAAQIPSAILADQEAPWGEDFKLPPQDVGVSPAVRAARYCVNQGVSAGIPLDATPRQARETISAFRYCQFWAQVQGLGE